MVIGIDLLRQFNVLLDYKNSRAVLGKLGEYPRQYDIRSWIQIPFYNEYGITTLSQINGADSILVWDAGANCSTIKSTAKISAFVNKKSCAHKSNPFCQYFEITFFTVGGKQLLEAHFLVREHTLPFDGLIGPDFFIEHLVFFAFKNNLIFIKA